MDIKRILRFTPETPSNETEGFNPSVLPYSPEYSGEIYLEFTERKHWWLTAALTPQQALELGNQLIELANQVLEPDTLQLDEKLAFSPPLDKED